MKKITIMIIVITLITPIICYSSGVDTLKRGVDDTVGTISDPTLPGEHNLGTSSGIPKNDFPQFIGILIKTVLAVLGVIFIILVIYAGSIWIFSMGDASKISKAKNILMAGVIGLLIILGSYIIVSFIVDSIPSTSTTSATPELTDG